MPELMILVILMTSLQKVKIDLTLTNLAIHKAITKMKYPPQ